VSLQSKHGGSSSTFTIPERPLKRPHWLEDGSDGLVTPLEALQEAKDMVVEAVVSRQLQRPSLRLRQKRLQELLR
jgi:hypothetical protein